MNIRSRATSYRLPATLFDFAWRMAILALPWQARWYREVTLAGWPWEQGSSAVYASWMFMAATIGLGFMVQTPGLPAHAKPLGKQDRVLLWLGGVALAFSFLASDAYAASFQWSVQIGLLVGFGLALRRRRVLASSLSAWFAASLIPHAVLAYWQYAIQRVDAVKWLGIAFQSPKQLGVSVVEFADLRYLRAYGGMPHPNILGGWLAMGVLAAWHHAWQAAAKRGAFVWTAVAAVLGGALVLTFSRAAYLALFVGLVSFVVLMLLKRRDGRVDIQFGLLAIFATLAFAGILAATQREVLVARTDAANRLVAQSTDARLEGFRGGWQAFRSKPLFGSGPNAELSSLALSRPDAEGKKSRQPLEPPHNVFFLVLVNFGIVGAAIFAYVAWRFRKALWRRWWLVPPLIVLAMLDHYLWSYWSGMGLAFCILALSVMPEAD